MADDTQSKLGFGRKVVHQGVFLGHIHILLVNMADLENLEHASSLVMAVMPTNPPYTNPYMDYLMKKDTPG
jgi:hypothetical protein